MSLLSLPTTLRLPHPYLTTYTIREVSNETKLLNIQYEPRAIAKTPTQKDNLEPEDNLHSDVEFSNPEQDQQSDALPPESNNLQWARARRCPKANFVWNEQAKPTVGQIWLIIYAIATLRPELESFRLSLVGKGKEDLSKELKLVGLAIQHPLHEEKALRDSINFSNELVVSRAAFWQGAGSPFGPRPVWAPTTNTVSDKPLSTYPSLPLEYTTSTGFPESRVHAFHPRRPEKPNGEAIIYSRYVPHLDEHFSMVALDWTNEVHLNLFHKWQNDPRVSAGWNETGTLEEHRTYLKNLHEDRHTMTVLAKWDDVYFAYFEIYWAKEDHFGVYCDAGDFDRGRHCLVGDERFRGPHRLSAWYSSLIHYMFLDDVRTQAVVGEPKATSDVMLSYDHMVGLGIQKWVDLSHKRSAFMRVSRERFFQLSPLSWSGERNVGGTGIKLFAKL